MNAGIPKNFYQGKESEYTLPSIDDLINQVKIHGKGAYIWKADLARAYRQLRLDPLDVPLFGIKHRGQYYLDVCPSFGARCSGSACQRTTSAVVWLMGRAGHTTLVYIVISTKSLVYIDDFCGVHRDRSQAHAAYQFLRQTCTTLGLEFAPDKCAPPSRIQEWLGFTINTNTMTVHIPQEKLDAVISECKVWETKQTATHKDIQRLAGRLQHISKCVAQGRKFMSRVLSTLRQTTDHQRVYIDEHFRRDVRWFSRFATESNGIVLNDPELPPFYIECDSCLEAGGGFSEFGFYIWEYTQEFRNHVPNIHQLEAVNILMAIKTLVPSGTRGKMIIVKTDNIASSYALMTGRTHDHTGSEMLGKKCIAIFCDAKPILYSNSYNLCSNSLFTFDTVLTDGMVTGHHHLRRIKNVYYALWADVGLLFSADSLWDNWPERVRGVI